MPELPEAAVVALQVRRVLSGAVWKDCWVGRPDIVRTGLKMLDWYRGSTLCDVLRYGKSVALAWERNRERRYLVAELGMTGLLLFREPDPKYRKHTHLVLTLSGAEQDELRYWNPRRFGRIHLLDSDGLVAFVAKRFGCDPLRITFPEFLSVVRARRGRLKALLMHQQVIAGIGNIYANEILYRSGLHPFRIAARLRPATVRRLYAVMQDVLAEAIADGGSSVRDFLAPDGTRGRYRRRHLVYDKAGLPCPSGCGRTIQRLKGERSSFYCPSCQRR